MRAQIENAMSKKEGKRITVVAPSDDSVEDAAPGCSHWQRGQDVISNEPISALPNQSQVAPTLLCCRYRYDYILSTFIYIFCLLSYICTVIYNRSTATFQSTGCGQL